MMDKRAESLFVEFRALPDNADEGVLEGLALPYGVIVTAPGGRQERFEAGAARSSGEALLNLQHSPLILLAREPDTMRFEETEEGLRFRALLPDTTQARDTWQLVRSKVLTGVSVEFQAIRQRVDGAGLRSIQDAVISGLGVAARPYYRQTGVEARADDETPLKRRRARVWL